MESFLLQLVPHENFVVADELDDGTLQITNVLTRESKVFRRPGRWTLEFEDGFGFLVEDTDGMQLVEALEEWMDKRAWTDENGDYHVEERDEDGTFGCRWNLTECQRDTLNRPRSCSWRMMASSERPKAHVVGD